MLRLDCSGVFLAFLGLESISVGRKLMAMSTNLVPGQREQAVGTFEGSSCQFRYEEPHPDQTDQADCGTKGKESVALQRKKHVWNSLRIAKLVEEMQTHDKGATQSTEAERPNVSIDKILE